MKSTALVAAALYAASPVETVWGRNAMQPFNYPSIVVLLTAGAANPAADAHESLVRVLLNNNDFLAIR